MQYIDNDYYKTIEETWELEMAELEYEYEKKKEKDEWYDRGTNQSKDSQVSKEEQLHSTK